MKQQYQSRPVQPQRPVNAQRGYIPKQPESSHTTDTALFAAAIGKSLPAKCRTGQK